MTEVQSAPNALWLLDGPLVLIIALAPIVYWVIRTRTPFRWFLAGAAVWSVGVMLKLVGAVIFAAFAYSALGEPHDLEAAYARLSLGWMLLVALGSGLLTGIFEGGVTLLAGRTWRSWVREPKRALAIGLGAGGWEALLIFGVPVTLAALVALISAQDRPEIIANLSQARIGPFLPWLIIPMERILSTVGHAGVRMLMLFSVARGRLRYFWYGFLIFVAVDGYSEWLSLTGLDKTSSWWLIIGMLPITLIAAFALVGCYRRWPQVVDAEKPSAATGPREKNAPISPGPH
jgi:hypothetical protein